MNQLEHYLTNLAEESVETAQRAHKAARFSLQEVQPGQSKSNAERIVEEFNHIVGVMRVLHDEGHIPVIFDLDVQEYKMKRMKEFLQHSKANGTLS